MKASVILSILLTVVSAAPPSNKAKREELNWYQIATKGKVGTPNFLSQKGGKIGGFNGTRESAANAGKFFTAVGAGGTLQLLAGNWDHQVGLKASNSSKGVMELVDLGSGPTAAIIPADAPGSVEWGVFAVSEAGEITVKDGADVPTRQWISYLDTDGAYYVALWDGVTKQPRSFANVSLIATKTEGLWT
ncbi:hypothetical protein EG328_010473 [Venturia inaequalis]|uniref:Uncharacterized protein n=1 Tax=Venturia inaequalis TaxID=5025 RepID=A0A8H3V877_VENIN|nr:hypothetical protein EG327_011283 [Venturia inaequalis]KAE9982926.1 hypothetical protein EG328_010473 [Venturia inaequalis]RDI78915.1 hypothetical protein Vi05172_g11077 [Venturia inaequalis]